MDHPPNAPLPSNPDHSAPSADALVHIEAAERTNPHVRQIARGFINFARFQIQLERFLAELPKLDSTISEGELHGHRAFFWHDEPFITIYHGQLAYRVNPARSKHIPHSRSEPWAPINHLLDDWHVLKSGPDTWLIYTKRALKLVETECGQKDDIA